MNRIWDVGFGVLTTVVMKTIIFWDITLCSPLKVNRLCLTPAFILVSCSGYSSALTMEAIYSYETSVDFQRTILPYIPEDSTLQDILHLKKMTFIQTREEFRGSDVNRKSLKIIWIYIAGLRVDIKKGQRVPDTKL
jgi:hypothetical protein